MERQKKTLNEKFYCGTRGSGGKNGRGQETETMGKGRKESNDSFMLLSQTVKKKKKKRWAYPL